MYEYLGDTIVVPLRKIIDSGIISEANYKRLVREDKVKPIQRACLGTPAMVDFSSFPPKFKRAMELKFGDPKKASMENVLEKYIEQDPVAMEFYTSYEIDDNRYLPADVVKEYYTNAIVLDGLKKLQSNRTVLRKALGGKTTGMWPKLAEAVFELDREKFPHTLPQNERRLKDRFNQYLNGGYAVLIHKNYCNKFSSKVETDEQTGLMTELLADPRNLDNAQVADLYNMVAKYKDWKPITPSAVAVWRKKLASTIYAGRRGSVAFSNKVAMQVKRSAPTAPLYYWTMDGWDVELLYQQTEVKKKKDGSESNVTTYHHRPTVVVVLDAFCKYPIGYAIGTHETPELITAALRNAAYHTAQLFGSMHKTHQLQSDRYAIKTLTPIYEVIAKHSTPARAKNAKAKIIEPYFAAINKKYCQLQTNWAGFGITSDKEKQPNIEYLNKYKKDFPDFDGVVAQVAAMMEKERDAKREQMLEAWVKLSDEDKLPFSVENYLMTFGETTGHKNMMEGSGLKVTIDGVKRAYDCFDLKWRDYGHIQWTVLYDPNDLSRIMAVNNDRSLRFMLEEKYIQPMALKDRKPGDSGQLQRVDDYNEQLKKQIADRRAITIKNAMPAIEIINKAGTLGRLLITDSNGQHKDNRNAERRALANSVRKAPKTDITPEGNDPYSMY